MPIQPTYPGVYIEELPSGVHTITGVPTSYTAFIGRAQRGPTNDSRTIESYADFERSFGGLWTESKLGYAVQDFYQNGGSTAVIVRLFYPTEANLAAMQAAAQDVAKTQDTNANPTFKTLADAMRAKADQATTRATKDSGNAVATAAEAEAARPTIDSVRNAAQTSADAISNAVQAVAGTQDTNANPTPQTLSDAMGATANTFAGDPKTAATLVATAAKNELQYKPNIPSVRKAAQDAANLLQTNPLAVRSKLSVGGLSFEAAYEGSWGQNLRAAIDINVTQDAADVMRVKKSDLFNLSIRDTTPGGLNETFRNLTLVESTRRIDKVLAQSKLVRWGGSVPPIAAEIAALANAVTKIPKNVPLNQQVIDDDVTAAEKQLANATQKLKTDKKATKPDPALLKQDQQAIDQATSALDTAKNGMIASDGGVISEDEFIAPGNEANKLGLFALEKTDIFNLLCIPPYSPDNDNVDIDVITEAATYCEKRRAMLLVDAPSEWTDKDTARDQFTSVGVGTTSKNAALFFPRIIRSDILRNNQMETFAASGAIAGIFARTDAQRGVWKAPAGLDATLVGAQQLSVNLTDLENGELNPLGINCLRSFPIFGRVVWGSRTLRGADAFADEYKYIPVRRTALFIEESLYRGTQWVVFEPNDEPLWAQIRLNVGAFMHNLFRQGAFQGQTPREAYLVKCDSETTTQNDIDLGIVNILVAFAPLKPAEFVIIQIKQLAGQIQV